MNFRSPVIHPLLFTIFPILARFNHNIEQLPFQSIMWPLLIACCLLPIAYCLMPHASCLMPNNLQK